MEPKFDPSVISEFAARLYSKARTLALTYALAFGVVLAFAGAAIAGPAGLVGGFVVGGFIGHFWGSEKAFQYRLQAQTALCQLAIAINTAQRADD